MQGLWKGKCVKCWAFAEIAARHSAEAGTNTEKLATLKRALLYDGNYEHEKSRKKAFILGCVPRNHAMGLKNNRAKRHVAHADWIPCYQWVYLPSGAGSCQIDSITTSGGRYDNQTEEYFSITPVCQNQAFLLIFRPLFSNVLNQQLELYPKGNDEIMNNFGIDVRS